MEMSFDLFNQPTHHRHFSGSDYVPVLDQERLTGQILRIYNLMKDGKWRTLSEIEDATGDGQSSISAQLRNLRKPAFGSHTVNRRRRTGGLFEYQVESFCLS